MTRGDSRCRVTLFQSINKFNNNMKTLLVAIGRMENEYAVEWVKHHLAAGFDHIAIYDNNRGDEERFEKVLKYYIGRKKVEIIDFRDKEKAQREAYNDVLARFSKKYDWIAFFDFDEFLCFNGTTLKDMLSAVPEEYQAVMVPWLMMTDNGLVRNDHRPLMTRFTEYIDENITQGKCILRSGIKGARFTKSVHVPYVPTINCCTPRMEPTRQFRKQPHDTSVCYLKHFSTKTIEEWLSNKSKKGTAGRTMEQFNDTYKDYFFSINEKTDEKLAFIRDWEKQDAEGKIALIALGRMENEYAREFVDYYLKLGFDKIIIADNNYHGEEYFDDVLSDYIKSGLVVIENYRDIPYTQCKAYNELYAKYRNKFGWIAFFDFDEFLVVNDGKSVKEWLDGFPADADEVLVNWKIMTDSGMFENDGRPMIERFTEEMQIDKALKYEIPENNHVKCIIRGGLNEAGFGKQPHSSDSCTHCYAANGKPCESAPFYPYDHSAAMLLHFTTKTIGEWMRNKWQKGVGTALGDKFKKKYKKYFFGINENTPEKDTYIEAYERNRERELVVCIVNYNTPEMVETCIRSIWKHTPGVYVIIFDNSDTKPFTKRMANVEVIDNTKGQLIDFDKWIQSFFGRDYSGNGYASAKHCYTVQWLIDHRRRPFLLMDSDVLIKQDIAPLFDSQYVFVGEPSLHKSRYGDVMRVLPYLCYIDVPMIKKNGISYYNPNKMFALSPKKPERAYDTGCWFYEDCLNHKLPFLSVKAQDYALHFGRGSWKEKDIEKWLEENADLWK